MRKYNSVKLILWVIVSIYSKALCSQVKAPFPNEYYYCILRGDSILYKAKAPLLAITEYRKAIQIAKNKPNPYFLVKVANAFAIINQEDSVFHYLQWAVDYKNYEEISYIPEIETFKQYYDTEKWKQLINEIKEVQVYVEKNYDKPLIAQLEQIRNNDQSARGNVEMMQRNFSQNSKEVNQAILDLRKTDSLNSIFITNLLDTKGILGKEVITQDGITTIFLVIQHSTLENQIKYFPMFKEAAESGVIPLDELAILEDRIAISTGEKQKYGSQISYDANSQTYYVLPIDDPDNVDKYREEVGLNPISEYVQMWKIVWDLEDYKKKLPEYITIQRNQLK